MTRKQTKINKKARLILKDIKMKQLGIPIYPILKQI